MDTEARNDADNRPGTSSWRDPTRLRYLATNLVSLFGFMLVGVGLILLMTFMFFQLIAPSSNPYLGIVGYLFLPGVLVSGLVLVPTGMLFKHLRVRRATKGRPGEAVYPSIDLNNPKTRLSILVFAAFSSFLVLPLLAVSGYFGFQWTESTTFCGKICHMVMKPQYVAHERSPHARVRCAECHIGPGASWFVKSKISGITQVVAVLTNSYPRPLPNAITNLRPARETCEECHWPAQFFGPGYKKLDRYRPNEANSLFVVHMLLKTGGANWLSGGVEGIHMHMTEYGRMEYVATDPDLQSIVWVRHTMKDGNAIVYRSDGKPADAPPPEGLRRHLDCMDCHNRGAHHFRSPQTAVDLYMSAGRIDATLPEIKQQAVEALVSAYDDKEDGRDKIADYVKGFYQVKFDLTWALWEPTILQAIAAIQHIYDENAFPSMREDWRTYPENIGHKDSAGCFRCHDGLHVDSSGKTVPSGCGICHVFLNPAMGNNEALVRGPFLHPMDLTKHLNLRCNQCHNGGVLLNCLDCHITGEWLKHQGKAEFRREDD
jgi:NapC/NirT cytochrome c family, N-terminal region